MMVWQDLPYDVTGDDTLPIGCWPASNDLWNIYVEHEEDVVVITYRSIITYRSVWSSLSIFDILLPQVLGSIN